MHVEIQAPELIFFNVGARCMGWKSKKMSRVDAWLRTLRTPCPTNSVQCHQTSSKKLLSPKLCCVDPLSQRRCGKWFGKSLRHHTVRQASKMDNFAVVVVVVACILDTHQPRSQAFVIAHSCGGRRSFSM
jgi:hypothetical protein